MSNVIECLKERGLIDALTSEELIKRADKPLKVYVGFDPTADSLHIGSLVGIVFLKWFQKFGHTPVVILGGATGRIGDPSGKSVERPLLDQAAIIQNVARIRRHFEAVLDFFHPTARPIVLNNDQWFSQFNLVDFLRDVGKHFRVGNMLAKESVRSRLESEEGISFTEFSYQLLQAYDFYHLKTQHEVEVQAGGSDQWGNITAGIDLVRKLSGEAAYGLTFPLLTRSDGKKFGKTEGGAIWLAADRCSPYQFYQYFIRVPDADVIKMMRMLTFMEMKEIREYEEMLAYSDYVPNTVQKRLAEEVTRMIHGEDGLATALKVTESAAPGSKAVLDAEVFKEISQDMPSTDLNFAEVVGQKYTDVAARIGLSSSKTEALRLIQNAGAYLNNEKVDDPQFRIQEDLLIGGEYLLFGSGKKKKILVKVQK
ncbi:MAG: tyrosine--tRNA ligase [Parachlamydiales bacterium]|nr:tyrosine--tRNA ligase [Verrucomicrobiota bacterium]MBX3720109.1 tyrosine--tRNA ligase [Candidatus Acheromyda pituitae]